MSGRVDFTRGAAAYDRRHGADTIERITAAAGIRQDALVLDVGAGTGRVAIPFAQTGRQIVALDPARAMLQSTCSSPG